jgi:hypothetical protein
MSAFSAVRRGSMKARKVTAAPQLGNPQIDRAGSRLPETIAVPVSAVGAVFGTLAVFCAAALLDFEVHDATNDVGEELADDVVVCPLFNEFGKCNTRLGHHGVLSESCLCKNNLRQGPRWPPAMLAGRPSHTPRCGTRSKIDMRKHAKTQLSVAGRPLGTAGFLALRTRAAAASSVWRPSNRCGRRCGRLEAAFMTSTLPLDELARLLGDRSRAAMLGARGSN